MEENQIAIFGQSAAGLCIMSRNTIKYSGSIESTKRYYQLHLDVAARRNLELTETLRDHSAEAVCLDNRSHEHLMAAECCAVGGTAVD